MKCALFISLCTHLELLLLQGNIVAQDDVSSNGTAPVSCLKVLLFTHLRNYKLSFESGFIYSLSSKIPFRMN